MIAPISERVPPKKYGGIERVVHVLTEDLVKRGHDVTLFATGDSSTSAKLNSVIPHPLRDLKIKDPYGLNEWALLHIGNAYRRQDEFDIIHDHNSLFSLPTAELSRTPVLVTIHGAVNPTNRRLYESLLTPYYVGISKAQTRMLTHHHVIGTVYNGLDMSGYPFRKNHKGYLLTVGRISMEKGTHFAIEASLDLDIPLIIAAKVDEADMQYFNEYIRPRLSEENVRWVGEVNEAERNKLMSEAMCLLHPVTWKEPFGLTLIEAMACGCPVIAFNKGSIPELVADGKTGFVVEDIDAMIDAIGHIGSINREACREHALTHFNDSLMTERYEETYYSILKNTPS